MVDPETGVDPVATDGEPSADELEARRASRGGSARERALAEEQARLDAEDGKGGDKDNGDGTGEADDGQLFVWEQGRKVTLGTLIARGVTVEHVFVFGGRRTKGRGGLMSFDESPLMVVRGRPGPVKVVPKRDDEEKVTKVTVESHVDAVVVNNADSEDGLNMLAGILEARGWKAPAPAAATA